MYAASWSSDGAALGICWFLWFLWFLSCSWSWKVYATPYNNSTIIVNNTIFPFREWAILRTGVSDVNCLYEGPCWSRTTVRPDWTGTVPTVRNLSVRSVRTDPRWAGQKYKRPKRRRAGSEGPCYMQYTVSCKQQYTSPNITVQLVVHLSSCHRCWMFQLRQCISLWTYVSCM